jgi:hypothetical protein
MEKKIFVIFFFGIFLLFKPLGAQTWQSTKRLTWNSADSRMPKVTTDSNNYIHVVWHDGTPGNYEVYYKKSTDGGTVWTTQRLTWNAGASRNPVIAIDSNENIHLAFEDSSHGMYEIYYMKSTDGGTTWAAKRLTWNSGISEYPAIAVGSNNHLHVVWWDDTSGNIEIFYKTSTDSGTTWTTRRLSWSPGESLNPAIAVGPNNHIHVLWNDDTPGNHEIYYKKSTNGGVAWTTQRLTWNSYTSEVSAIAVDSSNHIHVVWKDSSHGQPDLYYKRSTDGGGTWTTQRLTYNIGYSTAPAIDTDVLNHIHVVWQDDTPGIEQIYYKRSTDAGMSWTMRRLTFNSGYSSFPSVATDSLNQIHVLWMDMTPGNWEIFRKKGIQ